MAYYASQRTTFPVQLGHEWVGVVREVGADVDSQWIGKRVTGDTMLGCDRCEVCKSGKTWLCPTRVELGITDGRGGGLAEQILFPARFAFEIPPSITVGAAAMVEPAGNSLRAVDACALHEGQSILILGAGTIGLLAAQIALAKKLVVTVASHRPNSLALATKLGVRNIASLEELATAPDQIYDGVIDATSINSSPSVAIKKVKPGGRVALIGISESPSLIDTREMLLQDITMVGILSASPGLQGAINYFAAGAFDPEILVSEVIGLNDVASRLNGVRGKDAGPGPKIHVDPRIK
jgi:threonine dehydrogenase-like Zn-dependent dehydrogenase